jgi:hypothetical protein
MKTRYYVSITFSHLESHVGVATLLPKDCLLLTHHATSRVCNAGGIASETKRTFPSSGAVASEVTVAEWKMFLA